eukprot:1004149-Rhodomonas_salina.4
MYALHVPYVAHGSTHRYRGCECTSVLSSGMRVDALYWPTAKTRACKHGIHDVYGEVPYVMHGFAHGRWLWWRRRSEGVGGGEVST